MTDSFPQNTQLDRSQLSLCISLIENGINPEALAVCRSLATPTSPSMLTVCRMPSTSYAERPSLLTLIRNERFERISCLS